MWSGPGYKRAVEAYEALLRGEFILVGGETVDDPCDEECRDDDECQDAAEVKEGNSSSTPRVNSLSCYDGDFEDDGTDL